MTREELETILENHKKWLKKEENGIRANLRYAYLTGADLRYADLTGADLRGANLFNADLRGANINNVHYDETTSFFALQCPEKGAFIAYKKVRNIVIELEVPADAKRSSATTKKCRCSKAKVLGFYDLDRNELDMDEVVNLNRVKTVYRKGEMVYPDKWDEDRWDECSNGIHFFITFDEARRY